MAQAKDEPLSSSVAMVELLQTIASDGDLAVTYPVYRKLALRVLNLIEMEGEEACQENSSAQNAAHRYI